MAPLNRCSVAPYSVTVKIKYKIKKYNTITYTLSQQVKCTCVDIGLQLG